MHVDVPIWTQLVRPDQAIGFKLGKSFRDPLGRGGRQHGKALTFQYRGISSNVAEIVSVWNETPGQQAGSKVADGIDAAAIFGAGVDSPGLPPSEIKCIHSHFRSRYSAANLSRLAIR